MYRRYLKTLILALPAMLWLAGCSSHADDEGRVEQTIDILSRFNSEGKAWMSLEIPFVNQSMTRSANGVFDDGTADEYKVKDATILIFAGASEQTATFASAYQATSLTPVAADDEQVTIKTTVCIDDANLNTGDELFLFVVLNNNSSAITTATFPATTVSFADGTMLTGGTSTFAALATTTIGSMTDADGYFLMTNARLANAATTTAHLSTLAEVPASAFFPTEAEALASPAAHIHVERLAAKVGVDDALLYHYVLGNSNITFETADLQWALDNYNTSSYVYRHLTAVGYSRMVESTAIETHIPLAYRTHWAEDINYMGKSGLQRAHNGWTAMGQGDYCAENTFDVDHMQDDCTTGVLVCLRLNGGSNFYTTSVTGRDIIYQEPSTTISEEGTSADESFAPRRSVSGSHRSAYVNSAKTIDEYLREWLWQTNSAFRSWVNTYAAGETKYVKISVAGDAATGQATATVTQLAQEGGAGATAFEALDLNTYLASNIVIQYYQQGYCFYRVPIQHFGNELTPWTSTPDMSDTTPAAAYAGNDANYLGRYGVVRNNWYQINIRRVTHVGSPIVPPLTQEADDQVEQLLNATLTINNWTSHNQDL